MRTTERLVLCALLVALASDLDAQRRTRPAPKPPPPPAPVAEAAALSCSSPLGTGVKTGRVFCDILTGLDPTDGAIVRLPPHTGPATLTFDLHNRHTYSAEQVRTGRAYTRATATVGILTLDNRLIGRAAIRTEFRRTEDLLDRISGGASPGGVKAIAPVGTETVMVEIPDGVNEVAILGEKLSVAHAEGEEHFTSPGRPVAIVSLARVEYVPAPPAAAPKKR